MESKTLVALFFFMLMIASIIGMVTSCTTNKQDRIAEAIKAGGDPIAVKCSMDIMSSNDVTCIINESRKREEQKSTKPNVIVN